jgi:Na+/proline symporter
MVKKIFIPLFVWEALVLGGVVLYMVARKRQLGGEEEPGVIATALLGLLVVLLCWPLCRVLGRIAGMMAGFVVGLATSIAGGWIWSLLATERSFALPYQFVYLGLLLSIPSGIGGAVVGFLQASRVRHP